MNTVAFRKYLGAALRASREEAKLARKVIETPLQVDRSQVKRWEDGCFWPKEPEKVVAAYARETNKSPLDLWEEAARLARKDEALEDLRTMVTPLGPSLAEVQKDAAEVPEGPAPGQTDPPSD